MKKKFHFYLFIYIYSDYATFNVDMQTDSNHDTALTLAATGGHASLVQLLISRGADIEHKDKKVGNLFILKLNFLNFNYFQESYVI